MAAAIPTTEPEEVTAGTTVKWTRSLGDFPASDGWALSYAFLRDPDGVLITITGSASGSDHAITVDAGTTAGWGAGTYNGQGYVSKSGERYQVWDGSIVVLPSFEASAGLDTRSKNRKILDFLDASMAKLLQKQTVSATIEGVQFHFRSLDELLRVKTWYTSQVVQEEAAAEGRADRVILARFTRPI